MGRTRSATPVLIAASGMPVNRAVVRSSTMTMPPADLIARTPTAPSLPEPLSTTAMVCLPHVRASDSNSRSADGRTKCSGPSRDSRSRGPRRTEMCAPVGQTSTSPGRTASPSTAARTGIAHWRASTRASWLEGDGPRCWATSIAAGNAVGSAPVTTRSASMPPADDATPITTNSRDRSTSSSAGWVISPAYA